MTPFINILLELALLIVFVDLIFKTRTMIELKKQNRWCPRNRWYYSSDFNYAISYGWYKTIEMAQINSKNRMRQSAE